MRYPRNTKHLEYAILTSTIKALDINLFNPITTSLRYFIFIRFMLIVVCLD